MWRRVLQQAFLAFCTAAPAAAQSDVLQEIEALDWYQQQALHNVPGSRSTYSLGPNERMVLGDQARRFLALTQGDSGWEHSVAVIEKLSGPDAGSFVDIQYFETGYLKDDDWDEMSPDRLIQEHKKKVWKTNIIRKVNDYATVEILGWAEEPVYDKNDNTICWAIELRDSEGATSINAVALELGRHGVSVLAWIGDPRQFQSVGATLGPTMDRYRFREGARYADFVPGDALATVGLQEVLLGTHLDKRDADILVAARVLVFLRKFWYVPKEFWFILPLTVLAVVGLARRY